MVLASDALYLLVLAFPALAFGPDWMGALKRNDHAHTLLARHLLAGSP